MRFIFLKPCSHFLRILLLKTSMGFPLAYRWNLNSFTSHLGPILIWLLASFHLPLPLFLPVHTLPSLSLLWHNSSWIPDWNGSWNLIYVCQSRSDAIFPPFGRSFHWPPSLAFQKDISILSFFTLLSLWWRAEDKSWGAEWNVYTKSLLTSTGPWASWWASLSFSFFNLLSKNDKDGGGGGGGTLFPVILKVKLKY